MLDLDQGALDAALFGSREPLLLPRLLEQVSGAQRALARALIEQPPLMDVAEVHAQLGRAGLWLATEDMLAHLPSLKISPHPRHERWDALVEIEKARPEAAWLVAAVIAAMSARQTQLCDRALLGVRRRFGERGERVLAHVMRGRPLQAHVAAWREG